MKQDRQSEARAQRELDRNLKQIARRSEQFERTQIENWLRLARRLFEGEADSNLDPGAA